MVGTAVVGVVGAMLEGSDSEFAGSDVVGCLVGATVSLCSSALDERIGDATTGRSRSMRPASSISGWLNVMMSLAVISKFERGDATHGLKTEGCPRACNRRHRGRPGS